MFTTGMGTMATAAFSLTTMAIAVPTGVKIFNWIGTLWGGHLQMRTPMMFALGFIWLFMIGGFSGVMHAAAPADAQQHNSYFVVAHFHYVLIGGSLFALLAGIHYWFPLMFGRKVSEFWGKLSFWLIFIGFNVTFFPMHFLGLNGMPRRTFTYDPNMGWNTGNRVATIGAFILGIGVAIYFAVMIYTWFKGEKIEPRSVGRPHAGVEPAESRPRSTTSGSSRPSTPGTSGGMTSTTAPRSSRSRPRTPKEEDAHGGIHMPFQSIYPVHCRHRHPDRRHRRRAPSTLRPGLRPDRPQARRDPDRRTVTSSRSSFGRSRATRAITCIPRMGRSPATCAAVLRAPALIRLPIRPFSFLFRL